MATPSLNELLTATGTTRPTPVEGDAAARSFAATQQTREELRRKAITDEVTTRLVEQYPDASPQDLLPVARIRINETMRTTSEEYQAAVRAANEKMGANRAVGIVSNLFPMVGGAVGAAYGGQGGAVVGTTLGSIPKVAIEQIGRGQYGSLREAAAAVRNEGIYELAGGTLVDSTFGAISRFFRGNKVIADEIGHAFSQVGMRPALQDISTNPMSEGARNILGMLPYANKPFKQRAGQAAREFDSVVERFVEDASPEVTMVRRMFETDPAGAARLLEDLSRGAFNDISQGFTVLRRERDAAFANLQNTARQLEARAEDAGYSLRAPTTNTRATIADIAMEADSRTIRSQTTGEVLPNTEPMQGTFDFVRDLAAHYVPREMTFTQLAILKRRISDQIDRVKDTPEAVRLLVNLKEGVEQDMARAATLHPQLNAAYDEAMAVSEEFLTLLKDISSQRMRRIQRGFGRETLQEIQADTGETAIKGEGALDISQTVDLIARSGSPTEIRQFFGALRRGVGEQRAQRTIRLALGKRVSEAVDAAYKETAEKAGDVAFTPGVLLKKLGLDSPSNPNFKTSMALFEASGFSVERTRAVATVLDALYSVKNPKVAQMVARRGVLGGLRSVLSGFTAGAIGGATGSVGHVVAGTTFLLTRSYGKWMTSPSRARAIVALADNRLPNHARTSAMISLLSDPYIWRDKDPQASADKAAFRQAAWEQLQTVEGARRYWEEFDYQYGVPLKEAYSSLKEAF